MVLVRALLWLIAAANVLWGVAALLAPRWALGVLAMEALEPHAVGEIRSVFGGLVLALGVLIGIGLWRRDKALWLEALALGFAGLVVGRALSLVLDGVQTYSLLALAGEGLTALLLYAEARSRRSSA
jgi:hypothetical protein